MSKQRESSCACRRIWAGCTHVSTSSTRPRTVTRRDPIQKIFYLNAYKYLMHQQQLPWCI